MKKLSLDAFTLKMIAIISMGVHHTFMVLWELFPMWLHIPLYALRGVTFPIMAFFVTEGFRRTSNIKKYMLRLLIFALIAQLPYMIAFEYTMLNIIFTILLSLICISMYDKWYVKENKQALFVVTFVVILIVSLIFFEGGLVGPLMIFLFHVIKDEKKRRAIPLVCWGVLSIFLSLLSRASMSFVIDGEEFAALMETQGRIMQLESELMQYYVVSVGSFLIIPLLLAYNGERGKRAKFLFYTFYPLHFVILALAAYALGMVDFAFFSSPFLGF